MSLLRELERKQDKVYERVKFYDDHMTHYLVGDGWTRLNGSTYRYLNLSMDKCVQMYLAQGFMEVDNGLR